MGTWRVLAIPFPPCLSRKRQSWDHGVRLRSPFPPACRGKGNREVPAIRFSPCQSRKRPYHGLGAHLRWPFPPACRGKGDHGNMACACDSLSPLPVEETAIMGTWRALASPFSPCLSRKRPSWGACDPLFPLPVEEKDSRRTPQGSVALGCTWGSAVL